uniref:non-specific serine/threonine protein kinase n=1 Tax=Staphylothermus marinus TaxID=2280 RepID=A0A7C4JKY8_STAMA
MSRREEKRIKDKDLFETVEEVFDILTLHTIYDLKNKRIIFRMNGVVSAGKESRIYLAYGWNRELLALKIYLTSTAVFKKGIYKYVAGDPRFDGLKPRSTRKLIYLWARKEFRNLKRMYESGVKVPKPIAVHRNVLVMEFIGEGGKRYPLLSEIYNELSSDDLRNIYVKIVEEMEKIVCKARLVHGDLSEFNIMVTPDLDIKIIDVSQAVSINHPNAYELLMRDVNNIDRFFRGVLQKEHILDENLIERLGKCLEKRKES